MLSPADILSDDGPLSRLVGGFKARPQQLDMAETIFKAITGHESLICEAGTGTGKTFAYLIPAILSGGKIMISTATRHLQDQLYLRDMPLIQKALNIPVNLTLLKGRANYLCRYQLNRAQQESASLNKKNSAWLGQIHDWAQSSASGDLAELTHIPEDAPVRNLVISSSENCLGQVCDYYEDCFIFKARKKAFDADLVVVNHHLFLSDLALRDSGYGELLPVADLVIFDEAHKLPELTSEFFSRTLSSRQILDLARDCRAAYSEEAADLPEFIGLIDTLEHAVRDLRAAFGSDDVREAWHVQMERTGNPQALTHLTGKCHDSHHLLEDFADRGKQLDNCCKRMGHVLDLLDDFSGDRTDGTIQWLETRGKGFFLHETPLNIAGLFREKINEYGCQCIYTSATLSVNNQLKHFAGQMGLENVNSAIWNSPFDYQTQTLCYLPEGLPDPRTPGYTDSVIRHAIPVLEITRGRAFMLFTSHRALKLAAETITGLVEYPILVQGQAPRTELLDNFRSHQHSILLGTSSFWEGVDVRGQALSCVIIDKLPFAAPDDPVLQARMRKLEEQGGNSFMDYLLPEAVITLKQGVGRLIRDPDDYGVLMICDPRIKTRSYGRMFMRSLPEMPVTSDIRDVQEFFRNKEESLSGD